MDCGIMCHSIDGRRIVRMQKLHMAALVLGLLKLLGRIIQKESLVKQLPVLSYDLDIAQCG